MLLHLDLQRVHVDDAGLALRQVRQVVNGKYGPVFQLRVVVRNQHQFLFENLDVLGPL